MEQHQTSRSPSNRLRRAWVAALWGFLGFVLVIAGLYGAGKGSRWDDETRSAFQRELSGLTRDLRLEGERRRSLRDDLSSGALAGMTAEQLQAYRRKLDEQRETAKVSWKLPTVAVLGHGFDTQLQVVFERALLGGAEQRSGTVEGRVERSQQQQSAARSQQMLLDRKVTARLRAPSFIVNPSETETMVVGAEAIWRWHVVPKELGMHIVLITFETSDANSSGFFSQSLPEQLNPPPIVGVVEVVPPSTSLVARMAAAVSAKWLTLAGGINLLSALALALWLGRPRS